jgi:BCCT family betaine/carnitine transporter
MNNSKLPLRKRIDWFITLVPFFCILLLCVYFMSDPEGSTAVLAGIRSFLGEEFGVYYLIAGLGIFLVTLYMAFSKYGNIRLGGDKPQYSGFKWGSMMFTAGLAADILFYSLCEWMLYANEPHISDMGSVQDWASTYPLFHWGPIAWGFYMALAVPFGFMLHVRKRNKQKYSEACRPLLGKWTDSWPGRLIDTIAVFALIAGTATTFSLATPLLSNALAEVFGLTPTISLTILILIVICVIYTVCAYFGIKGVSWMAAACMYVFFALLAYVFFLGGMPRYIIETGLTAIGNVVQNFVALSTWTDALRTSSFPQNWTIFYWAYWMVWCVATPFFIGTISKGRTIRQTILGGYAFALSGTWTSFIILGNYGLGLQMHGKLDLLSIYAQHGNLYETIIAMLKTLPCYKLVLIILVLSMIAFYATTFDSLAIVASDYSYKEMLPDEEPHRNLKVFWSILLILLPIALLFSKNSMTNLQTVSIIAAFPVGIIMIMIIRSFFKDAGAYLNESEKKNGSTS